MFSGRKLNWIVAMRLVGCIGISCPIAMGQSMPASQHGPVARVSVDLVAAKTVAQSAKACLGGTELLAAIAGKGSGKAAWELRSGQAVLVRGLVMLDGQGHGQASIELPDVRHRAKAMLSVRDVARTRLRRIDILPAAMLRNVSVTLADHEVGVLDERGIVQAALKAQGVACTDLDPQLARDYFGGGIVVLAGFDNPAMLADACDRFESRVQQGTSLIVINPPIGWEALGMRRVELAVPTVADVSLARSIGLTVKQTDFPWPMSANALKADPDAEALIWFETPGEAEGGGLAARYPLVLARPLGKGVVLAATMPQLTDCYNDPIGRCVFSEIMMWILKRSKVRKEQQ